MTLEVAASRHAYLVADLAAMAEATSRALAAGPIHSDPGSAAAVAYQQALLLSATGRLAEARQWLRSPALTGPQLGLLAVLYTEAATRPALLCITADLRPTARGQAVSVTELGVASKGSRRTPAARGRIVGKPQAGAIVVAKRPCLRSFEPVRHRSVCPLSCRDGRR